MATADDALPVSDGGALGNCTEAFNAFLDDGVDDCGEFLDGDLHCKQQKQELWIDDIRHTK